MRHETKLAMVLLALPLGCYSGADPDVVGAGLVDFPSDDGDGGGGGDGDEPGSDPGDEDPPRVPGSEEEEELAPFEVPAEEVKLLPFPVRMQNLSTVTGQPLEHPIFFSMYDRRLLLGDQAFGNELDLRWTPARMQAWVKSLRPICTSAEMSAKYPTLVADPSPLIRDAFGRDATTDDLEPLQDIAFEPSLDDPTRFLLTCTAILTSLDFVAY